MNGIATQSALCGEGESFGAFEISELRALSLCCLSLLGGQHRPDYCAASDSGCLGCSGRGLTIGFSSGGP
jgi:hypothetical protein